MEEIRGSTLPEKYQVRCETKNKDEWYRLLKLAAPKGHKHDLITPSWGHANHMQYYHIYPEGWYGGNQSPKEDLPVIEYSQWKDILEGRATYPGTEEYAVGDWIYIKNGGCRCGPGIRGKELEGNVYQIDSVISNGKQWKYTLVGNPAETAAISYVSGSNIDEYLRKATPEEIQKAQGVQEYKIGDRVERLAGNGMGYSQNVPVGTKGTIYRLDVKVSQGECVGVEWDNGDQFNCLTKNLRKLSVKRRVQDLTDKECIACYSREEAEKICALIKEYDSRSLLMGSWYSATAWCYWPAKRTHGSLAGAQKNGNTIYPASDFLPEQPKEDSRCIGWQVLTDYIKHRSSLQESGYWWMVQSGSKYKAHVNGDKNPGSYEYTVEEVNERIKDGTWVITNKSNQNNKGETEQPVNAGITSNIKTQSNVNTEQKVRYTGSIVCSVVSQIRHTEGRRESGIPSRNSGSLIGTGYQ